MYAEFHDSAASRLAFSPVGKFFYELLHRADAAVETVSLLFLPLQYLASRIEGMQHTIRGNRGYLGRVPNHGIVPSCCRSQLHFSLSC